MDLSTPSPRRKVTPFRSHSDQPLSPTSDYMTQSASSALSFANPGAALLERWQSLFSQLTHSTLSSSAVIALNRTLDQAEHIVKATSTVVGPHQASSIGLGISKIEGHEKKPNGTAPATPPHSITGSPSVEAAVEKGPQRSWGILGGGDDELIGRVTNAADTLRRQHERFRRFHETVISEVEEKTSQIEQLQSNVIRLEKHAVNDMTELTYLRFKVRMLEVQILPFVPKHEHDNLAESVERWKLDWVGSDRRFRKRRGKWETDRRKFNDPGGSVSPGGRVPV